MLDEIEGRLWTDHGKAFGDQIARFFAAVGHAFDRLHAITWHKPWDARTTCGAALPNRDIV